MLKNEHGNGIVAVLMSIVILSIMSMAFCSLFASVRRQQESVQRQTIMTIEHNNFSTMLHNANSCMQLMNQLSDLNNKFLTIESLTHLSYSLSATVTINAVGPIVPGASVDIWDRDGNSNNYKLTSLNGSSQQSQIVIAFYNSITKRTYNTTYLVNVFLNSLGKPKACML